MNHRNGQITEFRVSTEESHAWYYKAFIFYGK